MMLAKNADQEILKSKDYFFEPKVDGYRALCIKDNNKLYFISRNGLDITSDFPGFEFVKNIKAKKCQLDGEIVIFDEKGNPSFQLMQNRAQNKTAVFIVFDIMEKDGKDLKTLPIEERKKILSKTLIESQYLQVMPFTENGKKLWTHISKRKLEGVIAKRKGSQYIDHRSTEWLKIKRENTIDCLIAGFTQKKREISSLCLGLYDKKGDLKFIGKVGTGFSEKILEQLSHLLKKTKTSQIQPIAGILPKDFIPVAPKHVCEIKFLELTHDFRLRTPVFLRLREDKLPHECLLEQLNQPTHA